MRGIEDALKRAKVLVDAGTAIGGGQTLDLFRTGVAEAVDRLPGISHQHHAVQALTEDALEEALLRRIGVLVLVDDAVRETPADRRAMLLIVEKTIEVSHEMGVGCLTALGQH